MLNKEMLLKQASNKKEATITLRIVNGMMIGTGHVVITHIDDGNRVDEFFSDAINTTVKSHVGAKIKFGSFDGEICYVWIETHTKFPGIKVLEPAKWDGQLYTALLQVTAENAVIEADFQ